MKIKNHTIALFLRLLPATNCRGTRVKITQSNNKKSCIKEYNYKFNSIIEQVESYLEKIDSVINYNIIINNVTDYYIINLETKNIYSIPDLIQEIKNL